jgi:surface antigen
MAVILIGLGIGGCSLSRSEDGPFARMDDSVTGSIVSQVPPAPTASDLAFARNAASDVLSKGDKDSSQHWENPETGARGSVTPIAEVYPGEGGRKCRDFLASYINGRTERWLRGAGCQSDRGRWEIVALKSWRN